MMSSGLGLWTVRPQYSLESKSGVEVQGEKPREGTPQVSGGRRMMDSQEEKAGRAPSTQTKEETHRKAAVDPQAKATAKSPDESQ